ncbi:SMI1/KNR4 family protein [Actinoplanes sp. NPDC023801]|uniref:SMI1/KNR4 family protein n=1 Tax=Actinoplanes sp. NPDC023801 TaxID=3154595 RepID=UPI0033E91CAB
MERGWAGRGPWVIAATSSDIDVSGTVKALVEQSGQHVAAVLVGPGEVIAVPGFLHLAEAEQLSVERTRDLIGAMTRAYDLVLISGGTGLLMPLGRDGWTLVDLAVRLPAPVLVAAAPGPDAENHLSLALDALSGRNIPASVATMENGELSVRPVGPVPSEAQKPAPAEAGPRPVDGRRFVFALLGVFAVMVLAACGLAFCNSTTTTSSSLSSYTPTAVVSFAPRAVPPARQRVSTDVCPEYAGHVPVGRPDGATTARVDRAWKRIEKWLAANAPVSHASLGPPAPLATIDATQRRMSVAFPGDLVASLRRHDGADRFALPPFFAPESVQSLYRDWQVNCKVLAGTDTASGEWGEPWWHPDFVPFAQAGDGGSLVADQRPGGHGRVGEFYPEDGTNFERWPASVIELLEKTATSLETGRPYEGRYRPRVVDGAVDWEVLRG